MSKKVKPSQMAAEIGEILEEYVDAVNTVTEESVRAVTNEARNRVRELSPDDPQTPSSKSYRQHWRTSFTFRGRIKQGEVYNTKYPLTHILEYGHAISGGGRTPAQPHISTANDEAAERFEKVLKEGLQNAT